MAPVGNTQSYADVQKQDLNELISQHAGLVKRIAHHLLARLHDSVQVDDLIQSGMIGLIEAAQKYDGSKGASFETYAGIRIRGAMLDEIRRGDWAPRSVHKNSRRIAEAIRNIENSKGRDAQEHEIAEYLDVSLSEYHSLLRDSASCRLFSYEDMLDQNDNNDFIEGKDADPEGRLTRDHFQTALAQAIQTLPEREQLVLSLYYSDELNLKEIGSILDVSESRVSQIHSQAAQRLRGRLGDWL